MKLYVTIGIFVAVCLGLGLLLFANGRFSNGDAYSQIASLDEGRVSDTERIAETENAYEEPQMVSEPAVPDSIFEICKPAPLEGVSELIVKKKAYMASYNKETKIPNWVAWHLTAEHTDGPISRRNMFYEDEDTYPL